MMGAVEKLYEKFESLEKQKKNIRESISSVFSEWKGFEEFIVSSQKCFKESISELESKEKELASVQESLSQKVEEVELERKSVKKRLQEVGEKEKEFKLFYDKGVMKLNKERGDFLKEVEFREWNLNEREKNVEGFLMKLEIQKDEIQESMKELDRRRDEIEGREKEVMERGKKVVLKESANELMNERQREVELKAKDLELMIEDLVIKEKDVELNRNLNENRWKELDMWEKQLDMKEKQMELMIQKKEEQLEKELVEKNGLIMKKLVDHQIRGLEAEQKEKEKQLNSETKEKHEKEQLTGQKHKNARLEIELLEKSKELDSLKKIVDDRIKVVESKHKHSYEENLDTISLKKKEFHLGKKLQKHQLNKGHHSCIKEDAVEESVGRQFQKQLHDESYNCNQLTRKESNLDGHRLKESVCQELQKNQLKNGHRVTVNEDAAEEPVGRQLYNRIHEEYCNDNHFKKKGSHLEEELQNKQWTVAHHASVKEDTVEELVKKTPSFAGKGIREEGWDLQKFLKEHGKELNLVGDHVFKTIQQSKEPAKLVLITIESIYNQDVRNEKEEDKEITFRSCILLLEQLMKLSVESLSSVEDEGLKLATKWKINMTTRNSLEVLGFLYLLASYKLAFAFSADVLMRFLEVVAQHKQTPDLCRRLGLKNKIPVLIGELIKKNQILVAFEYIHEFELVDMFPPVAILKRHVYASLEAKRIVKEGDWGKKVDEAQEKALVKEISTLKDVIKCITQYNLHSEYPPDEFKARVDLLKRQRDALKASSTLENHKVNSHPSPNNMQQDNKKHHQRQKARFRRNKRRRSDHGIIPPHGYKSSVSPPNKFPRLDAYHLEGHRSGSHPSADPYAPIQNNLRDPSCHVMNNLVIKYQTAGNWQPMYPGHPFSYVEDSSSLQPLILVPEQPLYSVPVRHTYDDRGNLRLIH